LVAASAGASGQPVRYTSLSASACCVDASSGLVTALAAGVANCSIAANQSGNANYQDAAQVVLTLSVGKRSQSLRFDPAPTTLSYGGAPVRVNASASASGLPVRYSSLTASTCSVEPSSGLVTALAAGVANCTVAADQAGDDTYQDAAQVTQTLSIAQATQSLRLGLMPVLAVGAPCGRQAARATQWFASTTPPTAPWAAPATWSPGARGQPQLRDHGQPGGQRQLPRRPSGPPAPDGGQRQRPLQPG
jgi:hypothetical protein